MYNILLESQLISLNSDLLSLKEEQLRIATLDRFENQLEQIFRLQDQQFKCQQALDQLMKFNSGTLFLSAKTENQLRSNYMKISNYNNQLELILKRWYSDDSGVMKQVRNYRTTLQAYGGVNQVDIISYYIDDKK